MTIETRLVISANHEAGMLHFVDGATNQDPETMCPPGCEVLVVRNADHETHSVFCEAFGRGFSFGMKYAWKKK